MKEKRGWTCKFKVCGKTAGPLINGNLSTASGLEWIPRPRLTALRRLEIDTVEDLLTHYPRRYEDRPPVSWNFRAKKARCRFACAAKS